MTQLLSREQSRIPVQLGMTIWVLEEARRFLLLRHQEGTTAGGAQCLTASHLEGRCVAGHPQPVGMSTGLSNMNKACLYTLSADA